MRSIDKALARVYRENSGRVLAVLIAQLNDFDLAEEAFQDAMIEAARVWPASGVPENGAAWLITVARRRAIDRLRKSKRRRDQTAIDTILLLGEDDTMAETAHTIPDERLRLIFTCCHPALAPEAQVALTLRTLCGLTAAEIAAAFLTSESTMQQRLTRAKSKIRNAGIAYRVPEQDDILQRLKPVLSVIYLIYNAGYAPIKGDLVDEAIRLASILHHLLPNPEVGGLLALMTLHTARNPARFDGKKMVSLEHQDRNLWDKSAIERGKNLLLHSLAQRQTGPYQIQAAISALHCQAGDWADTDWQQISDLYLALDMRAPSPIVRLNRAVALANAGDLAAAFQEVEQVAPMLGDYQPYHAVHADLLARDGQTSAAKRHYKTAISLSNSAAEQAFLRDRLADLG
ncbi:MAG: sigma-70 family RNA polymerase sigma factor [Rhodobacteraceae bacterium]|nr:sigma-70 family RNA polymerase sigma factor [Paracoccaceae bacterium]